MLRFLFCFCSIIALSTTAFSAEVKKISEKTGAIYIDEGTETGFAKGMRVCLFDGEKKIACGKVVKAVKNKAIVRVPKTKTQDIHTGFVVALVEGPKKEAPKVESPYSMSIGLNVHFMPLSPAKYNNVDYVAPVAGNTSLWETFSKSSSILIPPGFGLEFELIKLGIIIGARYGVYTSSSQPNNFSASNSTQTLTADTKATELGAYVDYVYYRRWDVSFAAGLDFDLTTVTFNATQTDSTDPTINADDYDAKSVLKIISLRLPVAYKLSWGAFGISGALDIIVPLLAMGPDQAITVPDINGLRLQGVSATSVAPDEAADLSSAINHTKNTAALDLVLGVFYQF